MLMGTRWTRRILAASVALIPIPAMGGDCEGLARLALSATTIDYYESVVRKLGKRATDSFVRLYMVPGMQHCAGGAGPSIFGQAGVAQGDARHNIAAALERWVEEGIAPKEIIAARQGSGTGGARTRPLCPYPEIARYKETGNTDDAANFECVAPAQDQRE